MRDSMHLPSPVISNAQGHTTTKHASVCVYLHVNGPAVTVRMKRATYVRTYYVSRPTRDCASISIIDQHQINNNHNATSSDCPRSSTLNPQRACVKEEEEEELRATHHLCVGIPSKAKQSKQKGEGGAEGPPTCQKTRTRHACMGHSGRSR